MGVNFTLLRADAIIVAQGAPGYSVPQSTLMLPSTGPHTTRMVEPLSLSPEARVSAPCRSRRVGLNTLECSGWVANIELIGQEAYRFRHKS